MWFKKKSVLLAEHHYDTEKSADGTTDSRTTGKQYYNSSSSINSGLPSAADAGNYFYLPALGGYDGFGGLYHLGYFGNYWSSTSNPGGNVYAFTLSFSSFGAGISNYGRACGYRVGGFE